jgi:hypothetical protein
VADIVSSQLGLCELVHLDQACCSRMYRPLLLSVFGLSKLQNFNWTYGLCIIAMLKWANNRGVTVCSLQLDRMDEETERALEDIVDCKAKNDSELWTFHQVLEFNLTTHDFFTDRIVQLIAACFPMLQKLQLKVVPCGYKYNHSNISSGLAYLAKVCPELRELVLLRDITVESPAAEQFLRRAHKLCCYNVVGVTEAYSMRLTDAMLLAIAESNHGVPHVTELRAVLDIRMKETLAQCGDALGHIRTFEGFCGCSASLEVQQEAISLMVNLEHVTLPSYLLTSLEPGCYQLCSLTVNFTGRWDDTVDVFLKIIPSCRRLQSLSVWNGDHTELPAFLATTLSALARSSSQVGMILGAVLNPDFPASAPPRRELYLEAYELAFTKLIKEGVLTHNPTVGALCAQAQQDLVTDAGLVRLVASCTQLRRLYIGLSSPEGVTPGAENVTATRQLELTVSIYGFTRTVLYK